MSNLLLNQ
jgi:hypothetical protein